MRRLLPLFAFAACVNPAANTQFFGAGTVVIIDAGIAEPDAGEVDAGLPGSVYESEQVLGPLEAPANCGTPAHGTQFADVTAAWNLSDVRGNRLSVADLDNDGYPDLVISSSPPNRRNQLMLPDGG